ncbi:MULTISPECIES: hypothetical protein [unclassified Modicisalibacter]|uniref:hypothetical protein n=1 Tax=unclassified Modicisalibacter TaxID=2679913 RepID=UPI001CCD9998|nr:MULTISPECIES: hypothetical protein [unclassified Modicisalibacter]MBZ9557851.1 hypothetical protein [Modicisalibacter sp. R2A 31.J]MBZ9573483.1 hypothetical protein [Modicisalibacter sp. MOD 31.J]
MGLAIAGVTLNVLLAAAVSFNVTQDLSGTASTVFLSLIGASLAATVIGFLVAVSSRNVRLGGVMMIVGSVIFVPGGLVAIFGAKRLMSKSMQDQRAQEKFDS